MSLTSSKLAVGEAPGLYGEIKVDESVIQQIWNEQLIDQSKLRTTSGLSIQVRHCGSWNRAEEGPDFHSAEIQIGDQVHHGDVEIHFRPSDWVRHRHHQDPNFKRVVLHVCLFLDKQCGSTGQSTDSSRIPVLHLLPYLTQGLEEYVEEFTLRKLAGMEPSFRSTKLDLLSPENDCVELAQQRWKQKGKFARVRLQNADWQAACHQWFLEVLGYRRNRAPMTQIALEYPISCWSDSRFNVEDVFSRQQGWKLRGCRPANHPRTRLMQYQKLSLENPSWPEQLLSLEIGSESNAAAHNRKSLLIAQHLKTWREDFLQGIFGGTRANTLWVDAILPLLSVQQEKDCFATWYHWPAGDCPAGFRDMAHNFGWIKGTSSSPFSNGVVQGIIGLLVKESQ